VSQFLFFGAIRNLHCVARRYNCVANCDAIPLTGNTGLSGSIFSLRWLQAHTKVSTNTVYELQYAHDAAVPHHTPSRLQHSLNTLAGAYQTINTKKSSFFRSTFIARWMGCCKKRSYIALLVVSVDVKHSFWSMDQSFLHCHRVHRLTVKRQSTEWTW